jgi:hypothetical protein
VQATQCAVAGCDQSTFSREWCAKHYSRWRRTGDPTGIRPNRAPDPPEIRFWRFVDKSESTTACWLWTGTRTTGRASGYGGFSVGGRPMPAHRFSYQLHHGSIPDGLVIDHLCRTPSCVRPDHLEAVENRTNVIDRGAGPFAAKARATHCKNGHEWTPENTWIRMDSATGTRNCRACKRERMRRSGH